jgi:uncharacterized protein with HEPN domain
LPSKKPEQRLVDIIENARAIAEYTSGLTLEAFEHDRMRYDAVERCLQRICEAAAKLGDAAEQLIPEQPWNKIRGLGNRLRHEYDAIQRDQLWLYIERDLPNLVGSCENALRKLTAT